MTTSASAAATAPLTAPPSPKAFAAAALSIIAKGLADESVTLAAIQKDLDALVGAYDTAAPTLVLKAVESRQMIYGWGSVVTKGGVPVVDLQEDVMDMNNLREVVHKFMGERSGDVMHDREPVGEIVDSFVMDAEVAKAFGVDFGREGWMVGYKVNSKKVWKRVLSGELAAFSIDVDGIRKPLA